MAVVFSAESLATLEGSEGSPKPSQQSPTDPKTIGKIRACIKAALLRSCNRKGGIQVNCRASLEVSEEDFLAIFGSQGLQSRTTSGSTSYHLELIGENITIEMTKILGHDWDTARRPAKDVYAYVLTSDLINDRVYSLKVKFSKSIFKTLDEPGPDELAQLRTYSISKLTFIFMKDYST